MPNERGRMTVQLGNSYAKLYGTSYDVSDIGALTVYDGDDEVIVYAPGKWDWIKFDRNTKGDQE